MDSGVSELNIRGTGMRIKLMGLCDDLSDMFSFVNIDIAGMREWLREIASVGKKKEAIEVIYSVEISIITSGLSRLDVLRNVVQDMKDNVYLESAIKLLSQGKKPSAAYKNILPADIIAILKSAESKQVIASEILSDYVNMKQVIDKAESKMHSALIEPTVMYVMVAIISYVAVNTFYNNFKSMPKADLSNIALIKSCYFFIAFIPIALVHFILARFPDRVPVWNRVYKYVKSANYLLIIKTFVGLGLGSVDAIDFFKKVKDKKLYKRIYVLKSHEKNSEGLTKVLSYYLTPVEIALLKTSSKSSGEETTISAIVAKRMMDVEKTVSGITGTFSKLLTVLTILPVGLVVYVLMTIVGALTQVKGGAGH